jgi:hypothetical protein
VSWVWRLASSQPFGLVSQSLVHKTVRNRAARSSPPSGAAWAAQIGASARPGSCAVPNMFRIMVLWLGPAAKASREPLQLGDGHVDVGEDAAQRSLGHVTAPVHRHCGAAAIGGASRSDCRGSVRPGIQPALRSVRSARRGPRGRAPSGDVDRDCQPVWRAELGDQALPVPPGGQPPQPRRCRPRRVRPRLAGVARERTRHRFHPARRRRDMNGTAHGDLAPLSAIS